MGDLTENNAQSQSEQIKKNTAKHKEHEIQQAKRVQTYVENNVKEKQNPNEFNGLLIKTTWDKTRIAKEDSLTPCRY